jgi:diaminopimelate epimerase
MSDGLAFVKGHGTENDFVIVLDPDDAVRLTPRQIAALCDRRAGVGGDGLLRVVRAKAVPGYEGTAAEWFMDYRNADGSIAEMCGNGARVFARYLVDAGLAGPGEFDVATRAGIRTVRLGRTGLVTVDMGPARFPEPATVRVTTVSGFVDAVNVDMGNPHAVAFVADLAEAGDLRTPPDVTPPGAYPNGVNVEYVVDVGRRHVAMRVHERGVGETRSCGTGACAVMAATARRDGGTVGEPYVVDVPGGSLVILDRGDGHLEMTGPAVLVASGTIDEAWLAAAQ